MNSKIILLSITSAALLAAQALASAAPFSLTDRIPIGGDGGWDYLTIEPTTDRLFLSHAKQVVVVDLKTQTITGSIPANGVHGIALAPDLHRGFISNGGNNTVAVFDLETLKILAQLPAGKNPDAICYEPTSHRTFAFNGGSGTATVIDAVKTRVLSEIPLGGKPEFAVADGHGSIFDALEDKNQIVRIDAAKMTLDRRWKLPDGSGPSGVAIDPADGHLFIGCRNRTLLALDTTSGNVIASLPIGAGVDACVYDAQSKRAFASCGDGTLTVVAQDSSGRYQVEETVVTQPRARTMAFDSETGTAYLPIAQFMPSPAVAGHPQPRPVVMPGTLELLVVKAKP